MKKTFYLHIDSLSILNKLSDIDAGLFFKAIYAHQLGEKVELPIHLDLAFHSFEQQFNRDNDAYTRKVEANKANGLKGGRPKAKKPSGLNGNQNNHDKDKDKDNKNISNDFALFWSHYPKKASKGTAEKTFIKIYKNLPNMKELIDKLVMLKNSEQWVKDNGQYIPNPSTWLNAKGWEDEIIIQNGQHQQNGKIMGGYNVQ